MKSPSGECVSCNSLGLDNCNQCEIGSNDNYNCTKCELDYFINEEGKCEICDNLHFKGKDKNQCFDCNNTSEGGIDKCQNCEVVDENVICKECLPGYILSISENSCLEIAKNKELENIINCQQLSKEKDKYMCSKCTLNYALVKKNDINECINIRSLYDLNFEAFYENHLDFLYGKELDIQRIKKNDKFIFEKYLKYAPCQEAENLHTEENPLYSCIKCSEDIKNNNVKIIEINSGLSHCFSSGDFVKIKNCIEATYFRKDGDYYFNCTKCIKNYDLVYDSASNSYLCKQSYALKKCLVLYCQECDPLDGYICDECQHDYELNDATGSCVKITSVKPEIIWKSIYNLNMADSKPFHDKIYKDTTKFIYGPSFSLRGITRNEINSGFGFFIYLTFKKKNLIIRNLQEEEEEKEEKEEKEEEEGKKEEGKGKEE